MAHNFQDYDSYFILQYLHEQGVKYNVIMRQAKVLSLEVELFNIRFVDSLNFIPMKLVNFHKKQNDNYIGPIPPAPYYNPNRMNPKDRETFMAWHQGMRDIVNTFSISKKRLSRTVVPTLIFPNGVVWSFTNCFTTSPTSICSGCSPSPRPAISCIAPITSPKIRSPSFAMGV